LKVAIVGPVFPFRAGIAYCTTRLAQELKADVISFRRQFPRRFYPGGDDIDPTLPRFEAAVILDILNPLTWLRAGWRLRKYDAVIFVWWVWVWAIPYQLMMALLPRHTRVVLQCHNIGDKEPAWWKRALTNIVLRRAKELVVHAQSEAREAWKRSRGRHTIATFLPVHELGGPIPSREDARAMLNVTSKNVALFFGHVRPFKALDVVLRAWRELKTDVQLLVAGEAWFGSADGYRELARDLGLDVSGAPARAAEGVGAQPSPSTGLRPPSPRKRGEGTREVPSPRERGEVTREEVPSPRSRGEGARRADEGRITRSAGSASPSVRFDFRFIPDAEIATWFAAADVVLAPYRIEAQSGVALTAFHFARPVIASTVGGLPEIVVEGQNGMLIPPNDAPALARAVDAFFARDDRAAMEQHAAEAARKYSWAEYANVFERLLTRP
jgi:glycosyltransferase involved in cell wall biosynthesis